MKTLDEVSDDKLRGGFYTPVPLVDACLNLVAELCPERSKLIVLEPSVGDGVFLRRLAEHPLSSRVESFLGLELMELEAQKSRQVAQNVPFDASILTTSALDWAANAREYFDVVVGNPPFVRYQFVSKSDLRATEELGRRMKLLFRGVSNLWIPVLLGALNRLRSGGVMAVVVPAEIFTGFAAGEARLWLLSNFENLRVDMFEPGSFPDVLQEVVIISGRRICETNHASSGSTYIQFAQHLGSGIVERWAHLVPHTSQNWTRYLLSPVQLEALATAQNLPDVQTLGSVARFEVSIVTGANDFFSVNTEELARFQLQPWAQPMLPRIRYAKELIYTHEDHEATIASGAKAWLLNFSKEHPDPCISPGPSKYIEYGKMLGLDLRYKTSIRTPWYRVPSIWSGKLLMSKRSHRFPRIVYNAADVVTTDTIYRGSMFPLYQGLEPDLVGAFHNSLTLLTAEIEGRSFGGGVLELVPSEIARLSVPFPINLNEQFPRLRQIARDAISQPTKQELLVQETDTIILQQLPGMTAELMCHIQRARELLVRRRLSRN